MFVSSRHKEPPTARYYHRHHQQQQQNYIDTTKLTQEGETICIRYLQTY
jgi:hypothetical protein